MNGNRLEPMSDDRTERELRRFLEWDVEGISGAPSEADMIERVARSTAIGGVRVAPFQWTPTLRVVVVLGLLAVLTVGAFVAGAVWNRSNPVVTVPMATIGPTARPAAAHLSDTGSWYVDIETVRVTLVIPGGWAHGATGDLKWFMPAGDRPALLLATTVFNVMETPCGLWRSPTVGPSVDDLVTALGDLPGLVASSPVDATVDGYAGRQLTLVAPEELEGCQGWINVWSNGGGFLSYLDFGEETSIWVLDVAGTRLLLRTMVLPDTTPQERAQTQAIFDSIQLDPLPGATSPAATQ